MEFSVDFPASTLNTRLIECYFIFLRTIEDGDEPAGDCHEAPDATYSSPMETSSIRNWAIIRSNSGRQASAYLLAVPNPGLNLVLESN